MSSERIGATRSAEEIIPQVVDERMHAVLFTLPRIRRSIPHELHSPNPARSWAALARILACAAGCLALIALVWRQMGSGPSLVWQIPSLVVLWVGYGWILVGLFVIGHDCGHRSFSTHGWLNTLVGYACMAPLGNNFHAWRLTHDHHHAYTQLRGVDVDWAAYMMTREEFESTQIRPSLITRLGYAMPFGVFLWIFWNSLRRGVSVEAMLTPEQWVRERGRLRASNLITAAILVCIYGGLWFALGFQGMLVFHGIPAGIAMATGWVIIAIQHASEHSLLYEASEWTPARGQMVSTFDTRFPAVLEFLWCNINIHIPHHVAPSVPWYHLKTAARALQRDYPALYQEQQFGLRHLARFVRTPFLKRIDDKGYYVLDAAFTA